MPEQVPVERGGREQGVVVADAGAVVIEDEDPSGPQAGGDAMGDHNQGPRTRGERLFRAAFPFRVQVAGRLVQDHERRG